MPMGLLQEAIQARERREAASRLEPPANGASPSETLARKPPRRLSGRSQNSRYDRDLSNIASFDRAPPKPVLTPHPRDSATGDPPSRCLEKYRYSQDGGVKQEDNAGLQSGSNAMTGGDGGIWRKISGPARKKEKPIDPALEQILWPRPPPPPSPIHTFNPPSPRKLAHPESIAQSYRPHIQPGLHSVAPTQMPLYQVKPYTPSQWNSPCPPRQTAEQPRRLPRAAPAWTGLGDLDPAVESSYEEIPYFTEGAIAIQSPYTSRQVYRTGPPSASQDLPQARRDVFPSEPVEDTHAFFEDGLIPSDGPMTAQPVPECNDVGRCSATAKSNPRPHAPVTTAPLYPAQCTSVHAYRLSDPTLPPVPVYDQRLGQWILLPLPMYSALLPPVPPSIEQHPSRGGQEHSIAAQLPAERRPCEYIPPSLETAYTDLRTPTRPTRPPANEVDMRGKKRGRAVVRDLERAASSSESPASPTITSQWASRQADRQASGMPTRYAHRGSHSRPGYHIQSHRTVAVDSEDTDSQSSQDHGYSKKSSKKTRHRHHKRRAQDSSLHRDFKQQRLRSRRAGASNTSHIQADVPDHGHVRHRVGSYHTARSGPIHRSRNAHHNPSPSSTETDTQSGDQDTQDEDSFTSPSDTPSSPSPDPERRVRLTEGAWAEYDVPFTQDTARQRPFRSRKVKSVPLPMGLRPRDAQGKWLPYATERSVSASDTEQEVEAELGDVEGVAGAGRHRDDIEGFSSPSQEQEERYIGTSTQQGLSPIPEEDEVAPPSSTSRSSGKKGVRWKDLEDLQRGGATPGVDRLPADWGTEQQQGGEEGVGREADASPVIPDASSSTAASSAFGEGFFGAEGGEVGFTVWKDGH